MMQTEFSVGARKFVLDKKKAEAAFAGKKVILGKETMTFNLLPSEIYLGVRLIPQNEGESLGA